MELFIFNTNPKYKNDGQFIYNFPNGNLVYTKNQAKEIVKGFTKQFPGFNFVVTTISAFLTDLKRNDWEITKINQTILKDILVCTILFPEIFGSESPILFEFMEDSYNIKYFPGTTMHKYVQKEMAMNN